MEATTVPQLLEHLVSVDPSRVVYSFLNSRGIEEKRFEADSLWRAVQENANAIARRCRPGDRVLVVADDPSLFVVHLISCMSAGAIAVPVPPPDSRRNKRRIVLINEDCRPVAVLGGEHNFTRFFDSLALSTDHSKEFNLGPEARNRLPEASLDPSDLALLQYTSGSTGSPKGVKVTHENLLTNLAQIHATFGITSQDSALFWLPLFHDMGLIGSVLQPLFSHFSVKLLPSRAFMRDPKLWLELISRFEISISGGPNFAYDLALNSVKRSDHCDLDLSRWRIAVNGAERVRVSTIREFSRVFEKYGFQPQSFRPCYGLAEGTLLVAGDVFCEDTVMRVAPGDDGVSSLDDTANDWIPLAGQVASVGFPAPGVVVKIVRSSDKSEVQPGELGEIVISGANVSKGYWESSVEPQVQLSYSFMDGCCYTGDLGTSINGRLYIIGRRKDLLIIRGVNYSPDDIEETLATNIKLVSPGTTCAISYDGGEGEKLIILQEVSLGGSANVNRRISEGIRRALWREHNLVAEEIVLLRRGHLPRTSSGKISRSKARSMFAEGQMEAARSRDGQRHDDRCLAVRKEEVPIELRRSIEGQIGIELEKYHPDLPLIAQGIDSLQLTHLRLFVNQITGEQHEATEFSKLTPRKLMQLAHASLPTRSINSPLEQSEDRRCELSEGQLGLWFQQQANSRRGVSPIRLAFRIDGALDVELLSRVIDRTFRRQMLFQSEVKVERGKPYFAESTRAASTVIAHVRDCYSFDRHAEIVAQDQCAASSHPCVQVTVIKELPLSFCIYFLVDHLIADLWSLTLLAKEIFRSYADHDENAIVEEFVDRRFRSYVIEEARKLRGAEGGSLRRFWDARLRNLPRPLPFPNADWSRHCRIDSVRFTLSPGATANLRVTGTRAEASTNMVLLTCITLAIADQFKRDDFVIGLLTSGRTEPWHQNLIGYLVNPVILRPNIQRGMSFEASIRRCVDEVNAAVEHSSFPFRRMVELARSNGSSSAISGPRIMCMLQPEELLGAENLSAVVAGENAEITMCNGLKISNIGREVYENQFDVTISTYIVGGIITCQIDYEHLCNSDGAITAFAKTLEGVFEREVRNLGRSSDCGADQEIVNAHPLLARSRHDVIRLAGGAYGAFAKQAVSRPDAIAVRDHSTTTFGVLLDRIHAIAFQLIQRDLKPESPVGICTGRSWRTIAAIFASWKAGLAFVPLDPELPVARLKLLVEEAQIAVILTDGTCANLAQNTPVPCLDIDSLSGVPPAEVLQTGPTYEARALAYIMFTSGSTGTPKGVMITHDAIDNLFSGLDREIGCGSDDKLLAVTSIAFDISIVELVWSITRGCQVVFAQPGLFAKENEPCRSAPERKPLKVSLFYFAAGGGTEGSRPYKLLHEGALAADKLGFSAIWTPERHFNEFGGAYPNPALTSAALAFCTERVQLRGGSVVMPLNDPVRVAEQWAAVDVMSNGRVGIAFASGWHPTDFVLAPNNYQDRKRLTLEGLERVKKLWRGEEVVLQLRDGREQAIRTFPRPVQHDLPVWLTSGGGIETFEIAGRRGYNLLTHLLGQNLTDLSVKIQKYRELADKANSEGKPEVALMLHAFLADSPQEVRKVATEPFKQYLASSFSLVNGFLKEEGSTVDIEKMTQRDREDVLTYAAQRYLTRSGLFGTRKDGLARFEQLADMGIDEIACLIDFGVPDEKALETVHRVAALRDEFNKTCVPQTNRSAGMISESVTLLQCTPSFLRMNQNVTKFRRLVAGLRGLMLGGEPVPNRMIEWAMSAGAASVFNMYGPTETTVWSTVRRASDHPAEVHLGSPLGETQIYLLNESMQEVDVIGEVGEIYIGGRGLARGYLRDPVKTCQQFLPDPFSKMPGSRLYRTGDLGRCNPGGRIEILGRGDSQVKIRGHRVELGEIESRLNRDPRLKTAVVVQVGHDHNSQLIAVVVISEGDVDLNELKKDLSKELPSYMLPNRFLVVSEFPLTPNGKIDRAALRRSLDEGQHTDVKQASSSTRLEGADLRSALNTVWSGLLQVERIPQDANFFEAGGHSLLLVELQQRLRDVLGIEVPLTVLIERPSITSLADYLEGSKPHQVDDDQRAMKQKIALLQSGMRRRHSVGQ